MDKIITVFSYIQHYVLRSSTKSEDTQKADSNHTVKSCIEQEVCPVSKGSDPNQGLSCGCDSQESSSSSTTASSEGHVFSESADVNERTVFVTAKSAAEVVAPESKSGNKGLNGRSWCHSIGGNFSNDKSATTAASKSKPVKSQIVLPLIEAPQPAQRTSKKIDESKRGRTLPGFADGSGRLSENTESEGNGNVKRKVTEKRKDKKLSVNCDKNSNLPNIRITAQKPLVKCFPDDQAAHSPEVQLSNRACKTPTWSKDPCTAFPKLEHELERKGVVVFPRFSKPAPANELANHGKPADGSASRSGQNRAAISGNKQQQHKSSTALGRWIKKRSNSVAPAPLENVIDPPATQFTLNSQSRVEINAGQREIEKGNQALKKGKNLGTKRGKTDSQFTENEASVQPHKTVFVKQRAENVFSLSVKDRENTGRKEKALPTGERRRGAKRFNRRECLNVIDNQKCKKNGEPSSNLKGLTMDQSALEKIFHRVTGRPSSLLVGHRRAFDPPACVGPQSTRFASASRHSRYNDRNLPKLDHKLRTYSMKPRLHSIIELEEPMQEDFPRLSTEKKERKVRKDDGAWRESASSRSRITSERPTAVETPQHRPRYLEPLASEVRPARGKRRRRLASLFSQASDREIFWETEEEPSSSRSTQNIHLGSSFYQQNPAATCVFGTFPQDPLRRARDCHDDLEITDFDDVLDF